MINDMLQQVDPESRGTSVAPAVAVALAVVDGMRGVGHKSTAPRSMLRKFGSAALRAARSVGDGIKY